MPLHLSVQISLLEKFLRRGSPQSTPGLPLVRHRSAIEEEIASMLFRPTLFRILRGLRRSY